MVELKQNLNDGDIINHESFRPLIPKDVYDLCIEVSREGFSLTLVGGAVRDWLLTGQLPNDLDFELRHTFEYDEKDWSFRVNRLGERLRELYNHNVEFLSFSILRVSWSGAPYEAELGPARLETYSGQNSYGHSDFKETLVSNAPYQETFKRRDFTINALGISFASPRTADEFRFVDPFDGVGDLTKSKLRHCSAEFPKDPVRFCRAVRFSVKYSLELHAGLTGLLSQFNLEKLTCFYFFREAFKTDFFKFSELFYRLIREYKISLSDELCELEFLATLKGENLQLHNEREVLLYLAYREDFKSRPQEVESYCKHSKCKMATYKAHIQFKETLVGLDNFNSKDFKEKIKNISFEDFIKLEEVGLLKAYHQFVSRVGRESLAVIGRINSNLYANFLKVYDVLPSSLLGKERFEELLKTKDIPPEQRGLLQYYAHFQELANQ